MTNTDEQKSLQAVAPTQTTDTQQRPASNSATAPQVPASSAPMDQADSPQASSATQSAVQQAQARTEQGSTNPTTESSQPKLIGNTPPQPQEQSDPAIRHAGRFYKFAQALAGGQRYTEKIDANTGEMVRTPVPLSRGDLGMAIAMEAITGALYGLSESGPGATGRAAAVGFDRVAQQQSEVRQQQDQNANAEFARHAQIFNTNLRLYQIGQTLGRQNFDTNQAYIDQYRALANQVQKEHPEIVKGLVNESDLAKFHVTKDTAIPVNTVPRPDPNTGKQAVNQYQEPQWDTQYLIVDPNFKSDSFLSDSDRAEAAKFRLPGFADVDGKPSNIPQNIPMRLSMALNYKARISALKLGDQDVQDYYKKMGADAPNLLDMISKDPTVVDAMEKFQPLLNASGQNYATAIGALGKTDPQAAGKMLALYGGTALVNKFDQQKTDEEDAAKKAAEAAELVRKERALIPVKAATAGAEESARLGAKDRHDLLVDDSAARAALSETPQNGVRLGYLATLPPEACGIDP